MLTRVLSTRRSVPVAALILVLTLTAVAPARAATPLQEHRTEERRATERIERIRRNHRDSARRWAFVIGRSDRLLRKGPGRAGTMDPVRWKHLRRILRRERWEARMRTNRSDRRVARKVTVLVAARTETREWIATWGIFEVCPVRGWNQVADNFGIKVRLPGVPVHKHMGNDVVALTGAPIVAPFDGVATASVGELGGMSVRVHGELGYVYNAHLSRYGTLGEVQTGDVVGSLGSTGDATGPHDHIEWHPDDGVAVDPYPYLQAACGEGVTA